MNRVLAALLLLIFLAIPTRLFAKGENVKIAITGVDLKAPIEITDRRLLGQFSVWAGPGTWSSVPDFNPNKPSFIVDWSTGAVPELPQRLKSYQVSFYAKLPRERVIYVAYYAYDSSTRTGYVYLPGKGDEFYRLNVSTIFHGGEGHWFHSWSAWDDVAGPLIELQTHVAGFNTWKQLGCFEKKGTKGIMILAPIVHADH